jgi:AsmA protein
MTNRRLPGGAPTQYEGYHYPDAHQASPGAPRRPPPRRGPSGAMLGLIYGGIGLVGLAVGVAAFVVMSGPTELIRREIVSQVKKATGRDLTIADASFTLFPTLGVSAKGVSLSAPPGMGGAPVLKAAGLDVGVRLLPLLGQEIIVDRLILHEPVFDLRVDSQGRKSWDMASLVDARPVRLAQANPGDTMKDFSGGFGGGSALKDINELSLGDIRIENGTVRYHDERTGDGYRITAINAEAGLQSMAQPLDAKGSLVWAKETVEFDGTLTAPADVLEERPAKLAVKITGRPVTLSYDGSVMLGDNASAEGAVAGNAPSLRGLAKWLGTELPPAPGFREISFAGHVLAGGSSARLTDARLELDGATATGTISAKTDGARPFVVATLKVSNLNLDNYVGEEGSRGVPSPARAAPPPAAPAGQAPQSIEDLLKEETGPQVRGYVQRAAAWSTEPLDLSALGLIDAQAKLSVVGLSYSDLRVEASELTVDLKDRVFKTTFEELRLYKGRGTGLVTLDATSSEAVLGANFALSGIAAEPLLKDAADIDWLAGTGDVKLAVSGRGASEAAIVGSLNGNSQFVVHDGALIGFNLGGAMRALSEGRVPDIETSPSEKTDFSSMTGSFAITNGIAKNEDLLLQSPLLRATGAGTVDLPQRSLDYTVRPKVVASLAGQGGDQNLRGIEIPVHISGSWDDPAIKPDFAGVINNPDAMETVKEIGKGFKGKKAGEIVEDLFGKGEEGEPSKAEKLIDSFFGGR